MSKRWHISRGGLSYGIHLGENPAEALLDLFHSAGLDDEVWVAEDKLAFANDATRELLGDVSDWRITHLAPVTLPPMAPHGPVRERLAKACLDLADQGVHVTPLHQMGLLVRWLEEATSPAPVEAPPSAPESQSRGQDSRIKATTLRAIQGAATRAGLDQVVEAYLRATGDGAHEHELWEETLRRLKGDPVLEASEARRRELGEARR